MTGIEFFVPSAREGSHFSSSSSFSMSCPSVQIPRDFELKIHKNLETTNRPKVLKFFLLTSRFSNKNKHNKQRNFGAQNQ